MKALCKTKPRPGAQLLEVKRPRPGKDDILIKVDRASICGSDLPIYQWGSWASQRLRLPLVFGHEFCGTVEEAGSGTGGFKKGDFVSVESHVYCGKCHQCQNGRRHVCQNLKILGVDLPGGFAEYAAVPARCAWKHPDLSLRDWGSLMEPLGNAVYAVLAEEVKGQSVLVLGCGPQGLFAVAAAKACGAAKVAAVEASAYRRKLAAIMGADAVLDPYGMNLRQRILKTLKTKDGADAVLEMSGSPAAIELGLDLVRNGGRLTAFGLPPGKVEVEWGEKIIFKGIRIYGIMGRLIFDTWKKTEELLRSKAVDPSPVVTHTFTLKEYQKAFEVMTDPEKKCGKVILIP